MIQLYIFFLGGGDLLKAVVFDLDHTLFDRYATIKQIVPRFREGFKINPDITDDFIYNEISWADKNYVHRGWQEIFAHLCNKGVFTEIPEYDDYVQFVLSCFKTVAVPFAFTNNVLQQLKDDGFLLGLITNGTHDVQTAKLNMLGITHFFDEIVITGDEPYWKPDPRVFHLICDRLGVKPSEMMYVGDHPKFDVDGSRNAGCIPFWVRTTGTWIYPEIHKSQLQADTVEAVPVIAKKLQNEQVYDI